MTPHPSRWNPDSVARWVCVTCGAILIAAMVGGAVVTVMRRDYLQSTSTFAGGILLGIVLVWYGSSRSLSSGVLEVMLDAISRRRKA